MEDNANLEERISKLEERLEFYDKIWFWGRRIGIAFLVFWGVIFILRLINIIIN